MIQLDEFRKNNLCKLENYLRSERLKADFNMSFFAEPGTGHSLDQHTCGTVGCMVGHGPYAGIPKMVDDPKVEDAFGEDWQDYSYRVFLPGQDRGGYVTSELNTAWSWLFDANWKYCDNSPKGGAARIAYFLQHGVPEEWDGRYNEETLDLYAGY